MLFMVSEKNHKTTKSINDLFSNGSNSNSEISTLREKRLEERRKLMAIYETHMDKLGPIQEKLCSILRNKSPSESTYTYRSIYYSFKFKRHPNGGGWVQSTSIVPNEVYLNKNVVVLGKVKILPTAKIGKDATVGYLGMRKRRKIDGAVI